MAEKKRHHIWPRRPNTERRVHPRVRLRFPVELEVSETEPPIPGWSIDVGLGGVRATFERYVPLFSRFRLFLEVPIAERDGTQTMSEVRSAVAIVRIDPDEEGPEGTEYHVSLAFTRLHPEEERVLATFLLQMLLYDEDAELA